MPAAIIRQAALSAGIPVWSYVFNTTVESNPYNFLNCTHGTSFMPFFHFLTHNSAGELPLVFNDPYMDLVSGFTASEQLVSNQVVNYWTNFHRTGNPNLGTASTPVPVNWPRYSPPAGASLVIQSVYTTVNNWNQAFDTFWTPLLAPNCEY